MTIPLHRTDIMKYMKALLVNRHSESSDIDESLWTFKKLSSANFIFWLSLFNEIATCIEIFIAPLQSENFYLIVTENSFR